MKTLKEIVDLYTFTGGVTEKQMIYLYITENNLESEYVDLISNLTESLVKKQNEEISRHQWAIYPTESMWDSKVYSKEQSRILDQVQRFYIFYGDDFEKRLIEDDACHGFLKDVKRIIPQVELPSIFFRDCYLALKRMGIYFKNDEPAEEKS